MIMGACKTLGVTPDYALHDISYQNLMLMMSTIPSYKVDSNKKQSGKKIKSSTQEAQDYILKLAKESE